MNCGHTVVANADQGLESLAAALTAAAYPVALRHAAGDEWLDLELELWRVLTATVQEWGADRRKPEGSRMPGPPFELGGSPNRQGDGK